MPLGPSGRCLGWDYSNHPNNRDAYCGNNDHTHLQITTAPGTYNGQRVPGFAVDPTGLIENNGAPKTSHRPPDSPNRDLWDDLDDLVFEFWPDDAGVEEEAALKDDRTVEEREAQNRRLQTEDIDAVDFDGGYRNHYRKDAANLDAIEATCSAPR